MSKTIGIVSEGPTDYLMLKMVIDTITNENNNYLHIQPEADMLGRFGFGWKGVWKWCYEAEDIQEIMYGINSGIDLLVIQMDGDVIRKEREVHCGCDSNACPKKGNVFPLYCMNEHCPIKIPCSNHGSNCEELQIHGKKVLIEALGKNYDEEKMVITIPCDSTDAWIVATYDDYDETEEIIDPWNNVIAKSKYYHDIRVRRGKKSISTYKQLLSKVPERWNLIKQKCGTARDFERDIKECLKI